MTLEFSTQKYIFIFLSLSINILLSLALYFYDNFWFLYILILTPSSVLTILRILFIIIFSIYEYFTKQKYDKIENKNIVYAIPCYNESFDELYNNINAFVTQKNADDNKKLLVIVCDGKVTGRGNEKSTDKILTEDIFNENIDNRQYITNAYTTWNDEYNNSEVCTGTYKGLPFVLVIKENNVGKRDSIALIRKNLFKFNQSTLNNILEYETLDNVLFEVYDMLGFGTFDCIIGTDGDTILDNDCVFHLITELYNEKDINVIGLSGFIKIAKDMNFSSPWVFHQQVSYIRGQIVARLHQSKVTKKVNCLPGCVQIIKIQTETCGLKVMDEYNRLPSKDESLPRNLRAHVGEDRMHICTAMYMYPYIKTKQSLSAFAYTAVPDSLTVYLSQRRRWSLGSNSNQVKLVTSSKIHWYERLSSFFSILSWLLTLFINFALINLVILFTKLNYFNFQSDLIWATFISVIVIVTVPNVYLLTCPLWMKMSKKEYMYLIIGVLTWYIISLPLNLISYFYTIFNLDNFTWGKTRECVATVAAVEDSLDGKDQV